MTHLHSLNECGRQKLLISSLFFSEFELLLSIENTQRRNSTHNNIFQLSNFHWNEIIGSPRNEIHEIVKSNRRSPVFISDIYCEFRVRDALGKHQYSRVPMRFVYCERDMARGARCTHSAMSKDLGGSIDTMSYNANV